MKLEDAGFVMRTAKSGNELEHIRKLPPRQFVSRIKNGQRYYVYAEPDLCKCVFLGNAIAFEAYRDMRKRLLAGSIAAEPRCEAYAAGIRSRLDARLADEAAKS